MRVSNEELNRSINKCNDQKNKLSVDSSESSTGNESLNMNGFPTSVQDVIYAKRTSVCGANKYYIMANLYNEPYRPDDKIYEQESKRRAKVESLPIYKLVECDKKTYEQYSRFLRNKNMSSYPKNII